MKNKILGYCLMISFFCWLLPFLIRLFLIEMPDMDVEQTIIQNTDTQNIVSKIVHSLSENDNKSAFFMILKANLKGCILNVIGGVMLGIGTLTNLVINGFYSADVFASYHKAGVSIDSILRVTLPHSFELIGFWLSGGIGFYIAWNIFWLMRGKERFMPHFYKTVGILSLFVFFIILSAAYVEAYISVNNAK